MGLLIQRQELGEVYAGDFSHRIHALIPLILGKAITTSLVSLLEKFP